VGVGVLSVDIAGRVLGRCEEIREAAKTRRHSKVTSYAAFSPSCLGELSCLVDVEGWLLPSHLDKSVVDRTRCGRKYSIDRCRIRLMRSTTSELSRSGVPLD